MVKVVLIKKNGNLKCSSVKITILSEIYKKCGFINNKNFKKRHTWKENNHFYSIYAKDNGKAGSENKYELPPPLDSKLYFGTMIILKHSDETICLENLLNLSMDEYNNLYEKLFGGFEELGDDTEESEEEYVDPKNLTKEGYDKSSGFIVSDIDEDSDTDFSSVEEEYEDNDEDDSLEDNSYSEPEEEGEEEEEEEEEEDEDEEEDEEDDDSSLDSDKEDSYLSEEDFEDSDDE